MTDDTTALSDLRAELTALRTELTELRGRVGVAHAPVSDGPLPDDGEHRRRVSRRGLLAAAVAGSAGLVVQQVASAGPAAAAPGNNVVLGATNDAGTTTTTITSTPSSFSPVLKVSCTNDGFGIQGTSGSGWGVDARSTSGIGLSAQSSSGAAVSAYTDTGLYSVYARAANGIGVAAFSDGAYAGVRGQSAVSGPGVIGLSTYGYGLHGQSAKGAAVRAEAGTDPTGSNAGPGTDAVVATSVNGYGVNTAGGIAPLRLVPSTTVTGAPTTGAHLAGELFVDKAGKLFYCTKAGSPGTWKKVTLT